MLKTIVNKVTLAISVISITLLALRYFLIKQKKEFYTEQQKANQISINQLNIDQEAARLKSQAAEERAAQIKQDIDFKIRKIKQNKNPDLLKNWNNFVDEKNK